MAINAVEYISNVLSKHRIKADIEDVIRMLKKEAKGGLLVMDETELDALIIRCSILLANKKASQMKKRITL